MTTIKTFLDRKVSLYNTLEKMSNNQNKKEQMLKINHKSRICKSTQSHKQNLGIQLGDVAQQSPKPIQSNVYIYT